MSLKLGLFMLLAFVGRSTSFSYNQNILQCKFLRDDWAGVPIQHFYVCEVQNARELDNFDQIDDVIGAHVTHRNKIFSNLDVQGILFRNGPMTKFPKRIEKLFPNLVAIAIEKVDLREIHQEDLLPFRKLEYLFMHGNKITDIEKDLFRGNPHLKTIVLNLNPISFIWPSTFINLFELSHLDLIGQECRDLEFEIAKNRPEVEKLIHEIEVGGCLPNVLDIELIKQIYEIRINSTTIKEISNIFISSQTEIDKLRVASGKLQKDLKTCKVEKERMDQKVKRQEREIVGLKRDNRNYQEDLKTCQDDNDEFEARYAKLLKDLEQTAEVEGSGQLEAFKKWVNALQFQIETQEIVLRRCAGRNPTPCPLVLCPDCTPCSDCLINGSTSERCDKFTSQINNLTKELNECQLNVNIQKTLVIELEKSKADLLIQKKTCEDDLEECKKPGTKPEQCDPQFVAQCKNTRESYLKCVSERKICVQEYDQCEQRHVQYNMTFNMCANNCKTCTIQTQAQMIQYEHLWEACTRRVVPGHYHPKCLNGIDWIYADYNPGHVETVHTDNFFGTFNPDAQCKEFNDFYVSNQLKECNRKLTKVQNFLSVIESVVNVEVNALKNGIDGPNLAACVVESRYDDFTLGTEIPFVPAV